MKIHLLSGFLGSGKTTAISTAAGLLKEQRVRVGVITNDQGIRLVDDGFMRAAGIPSRQVMNGCFCCNYSELDRQIASLATAEMTEVIFAESVGSCTDILATVLKPLQSFRSGSVITFTVVCDSLLLKMLLLENRVLFRQEVEYIYWKQIEEASLLLLNKTDLVSENDLQLIGRAIEKKFGNKQLLPFRAADPGSASRWMAALENGNPAARASPELDYDRYAQGEAMMGWLDMDIKVRSGEQMAGKSAGRLISAVTESLSEAGYPIGHVKWLLTGGTKISITAAGVPLSLPEMPAVGEIDLLLNARVQALPEVLTAIVEDSIKRVALETKSRISIISHAAFQPGYPKPEHRMA